MTKSIFVDLMAKFIVGFKIFSFNISYPKKINGRFIHSHFFKNRKIFGNKIQKSKTYSFLELSGPNKLVFDNRDAAF